jgi:hypothetical protein
MSAYQGVADRYGRMEGADASDHGELLIQRHAHASAMQKCNLCRYPAVAESLFP